ncbi:alginate lyase family protein, partial [Candidatus Poribacteria bacterium]|nr:alginate lyase family protein [Candidatus Poribacteria bacterium]
MLTTLLAVIAVAAASAPSARLVAGPNLSDWSGGSADTSLDTPTIRWSHADAHTLRLSSPPADWDTHNAIRIRLRNEVAVDGAMMLIVASENPATEGMDYWMSRIRLDIAGWREIVLPRLTMGPAREPLGWDRIGDVYFTAAGWGNTPSPNAVVHLERMELVDMPEEHGPRMTDDELLGALDLDHPGLEAVRAAFGRGDIATSRAALAAYLRERTSVPWRFDPRDTNRDISHNVESAEETLRGRVRVSSIWHEFPDGKIDWFYNPTIVRDDLPRNHEWLWQLGRMGFWSNLGRTYWATGDERYAQAFVDQLRGWVRQCPRTHDSGNYANSVWRTIECGIRMGGPWPDAYHRFLASPSFTDDDIVLYLKSCLEQAQHLREHPTSGNWLTMEMSGLYAVGALFPELRQADEFRTYAIDRIHEELGVQFLPDGAQVELTPGYHQVALSNILKIAEFARIVGRVDELPADFVAMTEGAFDFNLHLMTPDRDLPRFNDSWNTNVPRTMRQAAELFPERAEFAWAADDEGQGSAPAETSHLFPYAGYAAMRSGWERGANYLAFDFGTLGYGHVHQDKLNVVVWAYGRPILFDGGGGNYESSPYRRYDVDTFAHNTGLVDGQPQRRPTNDRWANVSREPIDARWESTPDFDFAAGVYDEGYGETDDRKATHVRRVLFVKPDLFVIADTFTPNDDLAHTYQIRWHVDSTEWREGDRDGVRARCTADEGSPNLAIVPVDTDGLVVTGHSAVTEPEPLGWWVQRDGNHRPATTELHTRTGEGRQSFLTVLYPMPAG